MDQMNIEKGFTLIRMKMRGEERREESRRDELSFVEDNECPAKERPRYPLQEDNISGLILPFCNTYSIGSD